MKCWESEFALQRQADPHQVYKALWNGFDRQGHRPAPFIWVLTDYGLIRMRSREQLRASGVSVLRWVETRRCFYDIAEVDCWRFVMVCCPVRRDNKSRKRRALTSATDIRAWMNRKGAQHGFSIERFSVRNLGSVRWASSSGHRAVHGSAEISGALRITDQGAFELAMLDGIGAAKSAGMGMLVLEERDYGPIDNHREAGRSGGNADRDDCSRRIVGLGSSHP